MATRNRAGETAETLILVGLILDIVAEVLVLAIGLFAAVLPGLGGLLLLLALVGFVWIALVWGYSYGRVRQQDYEGARTPTLVFAILSLLTLAIIPGILFLIAYVKLGDAIESSSFAPHAWGTAPVPPLPSPPRPLSSPRPCAHCGRINRPSDAFCEGCGAPLG